jgi:hypothetical protein
VQIVDGIVAAPAVLNSIDDLYRAIRNSKFLESSKQFVSEGYINFVKGIVSNADNENSLVRGVAKTDFLNSVTDFQNGANVNVANQAWELWKNENWTGLENLFRNHQINFDASIQDVWPPFFGFRNISKTETGSVLNNKLFDRFQKQPSLGGGYASPVPENSVYSLQARALGVNYDDLIDLGQEYYYFKFRIVDSPANLEFTYGDAAPWFSEIGGATQIKSSIGFHNLGSNIEIVEKWKFNNGTWTQIE